MAKTKIEWADHRFNFVWGCNADCSYCYARDISLRFALPTSNKNSDDKGFKKMYNDLIKFRPTLLPNQYKNKLPLMPQKVFVGSMSDINYWKAEWYEMLKQKILEYPQHIFLLLTKFPQVYERFTMPENTWFGFTIDTSKAFTHQIDANFNEVPHFNKLSTLSISNRFANTNIGRTDNHRLFVNFEPLLFNPSEFETSLKLLFINVDWVIIGSMSGRKRIPTKTEWVEKIVEYAKEFKKPVFIKQLEINGRLIKDIDRFPEHLRLREFPKEFIEKLNNKQ